VTSVPPNPELAKLVEPVRARVEEAVDYLTDRIVTEMEPYRNGVVSRDEVRRSMDQNFRNMLDQLAGIAEPDLMVARETGARRGREGAPLPELLRAYRLGFVHLWQLLVEEARASGKPASELLIDTVTDIWSMADEYIQAVTDAYRDAQADLAFGAARQRAALVEAILTGETTDHGTLWEIAEQLRMPLDGAFIVIAAETASLGDSSLGRVEPRLAALDIASAWRLLPGLELGLISLGRAARLDAALELITDLAHARVGVSPTFARLDGAPDAARLARIAMTSAAPGTIAVQQFDATPLSALAAADPESSLRVARAVFGDLLDLPEEERETLLSTLDAWLDSFGSATEAGRRIYVHPNTVRHRLKRIEQHTGRNLENPRALAELTVALNITHIFPNLLDGRDARP
jgi:hypothetical protein